MAKKQARPGRTLVVFLLGTAILYGLVALAGSWQPALGLDLQGGTRITLQPQSEPSADDLEEARSIIDRRVNGSGVSEAEVITQGQNVVVEIPGDQRRDLVEIVQRQAQLRFRLVACIGQGEAPAAQVCAPPTGGTTTEPPVTEPGAPSVTGDPVPGPTDQPAPTEQPGQPQQSEQPGQPQQTEQPGAGASGSPAPRTGGETGPPGTANRVATGYAASDTESPAPADTESAAPVETEPAAPTDTESAPTDTESAVPTEGATPTTPADPGFDENGVVPLADAIAYKDGGYTQADLDRFDAYTCNDDGSLTKSPDAPADLPDTPVDNPLEGLVSCSPAVEATGNTDAQPPTKYLLSPAVIQGTDLDDAGYGIPQDSLQYAVTLDIGGNGERVFAEASQELLNPGGQTDDFFAIVLDGVVLSAPFFESVISDGNAQISGNFTETEAQALSTSLRYGSLPISFEPNTETIGPSLAGDQLTAGLVAGAFGLGLVLIYCLLYYRGLGTVVVASLLAAAAVTYALVLLLSGTAGFVLTLPGIAGLIIAVGVTADSFIIFFERIRDEMREGKSMRVAVETGWKRARVTRLAAQVVSLLSAAVLYIFATGAVKGFGFALGLTTIVDLAILFWFTKPMVSWLARFRFFNSGSRWSGLSPETLGIDGPENATMPRTKTPATAGGRA